MTITTDATTSPSDTQVLDQFEASFRIDDDTDATHFDTIVGRRTSPSSYLVQNRTPYLIRVRHDDVDTYGELVIPPLGERVMLAARLRPFERQLRLYRQRHQLRIRPYAPETGHVRTVGLLAASLLLVVGAALYALVGHGTLQRLEVLISIGAAVALFIGESGVASHRERVRRSSLRSGPNDEDRDDAASTLRGLPPETNEMSRELRHVLALLLVVVVAVVLPVIAIIAATDTRSFLSFDGGLRVNDGAVSPLTARVCQMIYVSVLSLFPALLYFQFDRQRVGTLWGGWVRSVFRMDGRLTTLAELNSRYGDDLAEASHNASRRMRVAGGNSSPIVVATMLIALGWTVLVLQTESFDFSAIAQLEQETVVATEASERATEAASDVAEASTDAERSSALAAAEEAADQAESASVDASDLVAARDGDDAATSTETTAGTPEDAPASESTPVGAEAALEQALVDAERAATAAAATRGAQAEVSSTPYFQLLAPRPSAAAVGFLGAYFFGIFLVLRSYFRGDLRPKVYNQISVRLITVVVIAYLINVMFFGSTNQPLLMSVAFVAGIVPRTVLRRLIGALDGRIGGWFGDALSTERPLTNIDGIDLYDANLLEASGVVDVSTLANGDLVSVMVSTRLPAERLVDWADQAALMVVLSGDRSAPALTPDDPIVKLRRIGIRTATDFVESCENADDATQQKIEACLVSRSAVVPPMSLHDVGLAVRRQPAWRWVHQWRTSPLAVTDQWIELPSNSASA